MSSRKESTPGQNPFRTAIGKFEVGEVPGRLVALGALIAACGLARPAAAQVELVPGGDFEPPATTWNSLPLSDGHLCVDVPGGTTNPWDVAVSQAGVPISNGETYEFSFDASASPRSVTVRALVQVPSAPYATALDRNPVLTTTTQHFSYTFRGTADLTAAVSLQVGGASQSWTLCLDNFSLKSGAVLEPYVPATGPRVRVNQVGYLPFGPKGATLVTDATTAVGFHLVDADGNVVVRGRSVPRGIDPTSGLNVHEIRFDRFHEAGHGFHIEADGERSYPFEIEESVYDTLRADSAVFFYAQRSGISIDGNILPGYARAAGHLGVAPNLGDYAVPCQSAASSQRAYGDPWTCDYLLDVPGGWYDAGDQGKYVVNGGISVAQLLSTYERALNAPSGHRRALGDSTWRIPERGNGVPDILDEARWELEFLLSMQVPVDQPLAGMVHHKVHDAQWTALPTDPSKDSQLRELHRPSTAATLNLAAAAAQGARLYGKFDQAFAERLLSAARRAWDAALANPSLLAPGADGTGGGSYSDSDVSDEFYWAATELYLTTGEQPYLTFLLASPQHTAAVFDVEGFSWGRVAALARLDLATVRSHVPHLRSIRHSVLDAADALLALLQTQAWGQPYAPVTGAWVWGSSSQLLNNLVVLGTAYDLSGDRRYQRAVLEGVDFLLGRNALNHSFVTGYGTAFSQNQHTRIYANQLNGELPHPPIGSLSGGPNSGLQDAVARDLLAGCVGQMCFVDDINSFSTNEIAINWNAPLVWVSSFLADQAFCR